jgi:hypothetical protein
MVWKTIKAVYGYHIDVESLNDPDLFDEDGYIEMDKICEKFGGIKSNLDCTPNWINELAISPKTNDELIKILPYGFNGDGIAVGRRPVSSNKLINAWKSTDTIDDTLDYSISEFHHYEDKDKYHHYKLLHRFPCCSTSMKSHIVIGVTYDEVDRNLFLDKTFDGICDKVFNYPTKIEHIGDLFFQYDSRDFKSTNNLQHHSYSATIHSNPGVRKAELLKPPQTVLNYVNEFKFKYPGTLQDPSCYLMMDDCTFCT